ncbi:MAG: DUF4136 domain-containing protein [Bacteroides sp.]|nr:DUF4136 domain-containing protein [Bacteroides sp.]MCM1380180.1 DUF4136 domain-containing protein [Bacteroides sp.]MCM1446505.1 DUF4136 domain-containing protein [Prevotella sp.]
MKKSYILLLIAAALGLGACSPFTLVNSETYNNADLAEYKTFRIVTPDDGELPQGMQMVTYYNIAAAIREQMVERGYTESPTSPLLINFAVTVHREIDTAPAYPYGPGPVEPMGPMGPGFGPGPGPMGGFYPSFVYPRYYYWNPNAQVITGIYKEGVLTVDMVNINEKLPLFSASVATIINGSQGQYRNLTAISEAVSTLFSKFPVPLLSEYRNNK